jgi:prepilin signal peptidase PulO-like enzyme (type II secretory pathway)
MEYINVPSMILRGGGILALTLGVTFWFGNFTYLQPLHMVLGVLVVGSLLWLAVLFARAGMGATLTSVAVLVGLALVLVGVTQKQVLTNSNHWIIQVVHLVLGVSALSLGEIMAARLNRAAKAA